MAKFIVESSRQKVVPQHDSMGIAGQVQIDGVCRQCVHELAAPGLGDGIEQFAHGWLAEAAHCWAMSRIGCRATKSVVGQPGHSSCAEESFHRCAGVLSRKILFTWSRGSR